ncbi:Hypothetical predicted protein [Lecanosticta acicola]|uniref:Uncharacterized protein n=1 Tax=Lecanosticta acicola TaxID=111012 RepID=A0AAI9EBY1_9PEZI|nr:Hypothetical predicted protein [Lecanosticta acicola]
MSSRLSCYLCTKLKPLVQDVTSAISELDETIQSFCGSSGSIGRGTSAFSEGDSPTRAIQWILERLHYAKHDLQQAARRNRESYQYQPHQSQISGASPQQTSPRNPLKRSAEPWDRDDFHGLKRPRSGASSAQPFQLPTLTTHGIAREYIDSSIRDLGPRASPAPSESVPGSAHPRQTSPTPTSRLNTRALPSPSSLAYSLSAAPSLAPVTGQNIASPALSYRQAPSVDTASTNSATSAHIADLQHQITLKSLALQTLQTEYSSLLQKLQRERVKGQAMEKKTSVADQEVNDLTTKNEELTEQVKSLEAQLEECEGKREAARVESSREKDQWGRMLEMGGRLQAKIDGERQKLLEEKAALQQRLFRLEGLKGNQQADDLDSTERGQTVMPNSSKSDQSKSTGTIHAESTAQVNSEIQHNQVAGLRHQVASLNRRIDTLRLALEGAKRQNAEIGQQAHGLLERSTTFSNTIEQAIQEDDVQAEQTNLSPQRKTNTCSTPVRMQMRCDPPEPPHMPSATSLSPQTFRSKSGSRTSTLEVYRDGKVKTAIVADVARAASPAPEELGIHVTPSTSTPEELIRALGPVPAPLPSLQFQARGNYWGFPSTGQSANGARELRDMPRLPAVRVSQTSDHDTSPRSYHSSPGELVEDRSSNASSANRSPEAYVSDSEGKGSGTRPKSKQTFSRFPPLHLETTRSQEAGTHRYHGSHYTWVPAMPPPPRPGPTSSFTP